MEKIHKVIETLEAIGFLLEKVKHEIDYVENGVKNNVKELEVQFTQLHRYCVRRELEHAYRMKKLLSDLEAWRRIKSPEKYSTPESRLSMGNLTNGISDGNQPTYDLSRTWQPQNSQQLSVYNWLPEQLLDQPEPQEWTQTQPLPTFQSLQWQQQHRQQQQLMFPEMKQYEDAYVSEDSMECVDWNKERRERELYKRCLEVKMGWRLSGSNFDELVRLFADFTSSLVKWNIASPGVDAKTGQPLFIAVFESAKYRDMVISVRHQITEEGHFLVDECLTYIEKKERARMGEMVEKLRSLGKSVVFENRRIRVEGIWWKYNFAQGWLMLDEAGNCV